MKPSILVLGGILIVVLVAVGMLGFSETGQVIGPDDSGTESGEDTTPPVTEPDTPVINDRDYTEISEIVTDSLSFMDETVWVTGVLKQYYWAPDDYYIEDGQGYAIEMQRVDLYNYELNENYDIRGRVHLDRYCDCETREPIYLWRDYGELVVEECAEMGRCKPGTYKSYANDQNTYCICEIQQFFKYYWAPEGRMNVKECPDTEERRCRQGSFEHDEPYLVIEQIEIA